MPLQNFNAEFDYLIIVSLIMVFKNLNSTEQCLRQEIKVNIIQMYSFTFIR